MFSDGIACKPCWQWEPTDGLGLIVITNNLYLPNSSATQYVHVPINVSTAIVIYYTIDVLISQCDRNVCLNFTVHFKGKLVTLIISFTVLHGISPYEFTINHISIHDISGKL